MKKDLYMSDEHRLLSEEDYETMLEWNDREVAFIKNDVVANDEVWGIYSADGTQLAIADSRDFAFVIAKQNDLKPQSVH